MTNIKFERNGENFNYRVSDEGPYKKEVCLWHNGGTSLFRDIVQNEEEIDDIIEERVNLFLEGNIHCCDCGKKINYNENNRHRYFAGIYCSECWEREWRERESKETYN